VKRPGWLGGGPDPEEGEDAGGGRKGESEREQRERLAKARRERARKARADLAAKARDADEAEGQEKPNEPRRQRPARSKTSTKAKPTAKGRPTAESKPSAKGRPTPKAGSHPSRSRDSKGGRRTTGAGSSRRGPAGGRAKRLGAGLVPAARRGAKVARARALVLAPRVGQDLLRGLLVLFGIFFAVLAFVLNVAIAIWRIADGPVRALVGRLSRWTNAASRALTPTRVLALVVAGAIVLLALSQFADYRNISIGNDAYSGGIQTVAPAPVKETDATGSAHSYAMVPLAAVSLLLLGAAMTGRWRLCRLIALAGIAAIAVGLLHDRPTGLDPGERAVAYEGVKATLLGGFYAQLASGLLLTVSSLLLGRELRLAGATTPARSKRTSRAPRRLRLRRRAGVEGASA
jgi:hypothetical protein